MNNPFELEKVREIIFTHTSSGEVEQAYLLLFGLEHCKVERCSNPAALKISYNLRHYTLEGLETALAEEGFMLDDSLLHNIGRKVIYYCEDTTCHNLDIPTHPTKKNEQKVFVNTAVSDGDNHADAPPHLREYK